MTERPDLIFGAFLVLAIAAAVALLGAMVEAGLQGLAGIAAVSAGLVSACILFAIELRQLPPALVFVSLTAVASGIALLRALRSIWCEQRLLRALPVAALSDSDYRGEIPSHPDDVDIHVLPSHRQAAFCAGLVRPRVVVTTALLDALDREERRAVFVHELSHTRRRAPLKLAFGRLVVRTLFWVPVLRDLVDRYLLLTELAADRAAAAATSPAALAGALSQVLTTPALAGSVGLADHAAARIDRLFDPRARLPRLVTPTRAATTGLAIGMAAALAYSSPQLSSSESVQLRTMSVNLLAHHVQARLIGFAITAVTVSVVLAVMHRFLGRPQRALPGLGSRQSRPT
jgi:Zn-dependent protease with chaperone function